MLIGSLLAVGSLGSAVLLSSAAAESGSGTVATTGDATSVTMTAAQLNGVIDPSYSDSAWFFEYARSPDFKTDEHVTKPQAAGLGMQAVSAHISSLAPNTVYYFRLGVAWQPGTGHPTGEFGATHSFRTLSARAPVGRTVYTGKRVVRVRHGQVSLPMSCRGGGGAACAARVAVTTTVRSGHRARLVVCAAGQYAAVAPNGRTIRMRISQACSVLVRHARRHRLAGDVWVVGTSGRTIRPVTLAG